MFPEIETKRLKLRALVADDDAFIYKLRSHPDTFKYVDIVPYQDIQRAQRFIAAVQKDIETNEAFFWGIVNKESDEMVGTICLWNFEPQEGAKVAAGVKAELGYEVHPDYQGKGFAKEAIGGVIEYARAFSQLKTIDAITHKDNIPSIKVLERYAFEALGIAVAFDPEIEEGPEMLLFRLGLKD
jgi:ribosomal-protein-alanine N-acetyltransferase